MKKVFYFTIAGMMLLGVQSCKQETKKMNEPKPIDLANLDTTANPAEDFNQYANGGWIKNNPVPEDKSSYGTFNELIDKNEKQLKDVVTDIAKANNPKGSVAEKIAMFYNSGMDTVAIEKNGTTILKEELDRINKISSLKDIQQQFVHFHKYFISTGFGLYGGADEKNSDMVITQIYQSGLGLPDRDYYLSDAQHFADIRDKYKEHLTKMFMLFGNDEETAVENTKKVYDIEYKLAEVSMDRITQRDPHKTYNKKTIAELQELTPNFNWKTYLIGLGLSDVKEVIVGQPDFLKGFNELFTSKSVDDWKAYFKWNLIDANASYLNDDIVKQNFDFYGKTLSGTPIMRPRWKRVLGATNGTLSEAVGQIYVEKYFPPEAKERMVKLVDNLKTALGERIQNLTWMSEATKDSALNKLAAIRVKVGYPDKWKDYSKLEVKDDAYVLNIMRAREFAFNKMIDKIDKPVDKTEWHMSPQTVNAYYNPTANEIVFPAGILQPPFFFLNGDDAVNYGAIGVVIGHEMTHGFDDQGRLFDKKGNLNSWWTEEDSKQFKERTDVLVHQFNEFVVLDTVHANGEYTLGENIADFGGLNVSYTAFKKTEQWKHQDKKIDEFTPNQRFYLAYAHVWAQNIRDEEKLRRTQEDVHSLGKFRVNGPLRNLPEFHVAFNVKPGDYMYLPENERAVIW
jgi:putative endopeptidase